MITDKRLKFVISSPKGNLSGGTLVLNLLCELLSKKGYDAKILLAAPTSPISSFSFRLGYLCTVNKYLLRQLIYKLLGRFEFIKKNPKIGCFANLKIKNKVKYLPFVSKDTIVVYPELVSGNPLKSPNVVRWFLNKPGYFTGKINYGKGELYFCYQKVFNDLKISPTERFFMIKYIDKSLYNQIAPGVRNGTCYIIRKGSDREDLPSSLDGPIIDSLSEQEILKCFSTHKYCVSYDTMTFYSQIASICGCISIVIPQIGVSKEEWQPLENLKYGIAYGFDESEISYALKTRELLIKDIRKTDDDNNRMMDYFINECYNFFVKK